MGVRFILGFPTVNPVWEIWNVSPIMASKMNTSNTKAGVQYNIYFVGWKGLFWELHVFMVARNNYHNLNNRTKKYVVQNHPIQLVDNHTLIWLYYINSLYNGKMYEKPSGDDSPNPTHHTHHSSDVRAWGHDQIRPDTCHDITIVIPYLLVKSHYIPTISQQEIGKSSSTATLPTAAAFGSKRLFRAMQVSCV